MQQRIIVGLMVLATAARLAVILRMAISRLVVRYPLFMLMTIFSTARMAAGLMVMLNTGGVQRLYFPFWQATEDLTLLFQAAACLEAFWILALHFRNIRAWGTILLSLIAIAGGVFAYGVVAVWSGKWSTPLASALILMQRVGLTLIVIAFLSQLFFRQFPTVPIKPNAIRHLWILIFLFGSFFAAGFAGAGWNFVSNAALIFGTLVAYTCWAIFMTARGEELPFPAPPPLSGPDFEAADATDRKTMDQVVRGAAISKVK